MGYHNRDVMAGGKKNKMSPIVVQQQKLAWVCSGKPTLPGLQKSSYFPKLSMCPAAAL